MYAWIGSHFRPPPFGCHGRSATLDNIFNRTIWWRSLNPDNITDWIRQRAKNKRNEKKKDSSVYGQIQNSVAPWVAVVIQKNLRPTICLINLYTLQIKQSRRVLNRWSHVKCPLPEQRKINQMQLLISSGNVPILSCKLRTSKENAICIFKSCKQLNQPQVSIN